MGDPVTLIANWLRDLLGGWGLAPGLVTFILALLGVVILATVALVLDIFLVWVERKVVARFQDRLGPNRLGPYGLVQPFADIIKLLIKEDITPIGADRIVFNLAPIMALGTVLALWAVIPISATVYGTNVNVGVLYIVAIGAISTLGIIMAGWASNNKYALLGAFRTVAQMISYEIPLVISLLVPVILARSMGLKDIVDQQAVWFIVVAPLAAMIFLISNIAELGRAPFDLTEAEFEIVAGFHIEYTGMKFGLFYAGELLHALTIGAIFSTLFLGGWRGPGAETYPIVGVFWFFLKSMFMYWVIMWVKYTFPRIRIDHMLNLNWKFFTPLALISVMVTAVLVKLVPQDNLFVYITIMLLANVLMVWGTLQVLRSGARSARQRVGEPRPVATPPAQQTVSASQPPSGSPQ